MSAVAKPRPGRRPDPALHACWRERLLRFEQSGLSATAFCAQEGLPLSSFHAWRRRLRPKATTSGADAPTIPLLPVRLQGSAAPVELLLPCGAVLRLGPGCDLDLVRSLLRLLTEGAPC